MFALHSRHTSASFAAAALVWTKFTAEEQRSAQASMNGGVNSRWRQQTHGRAQRLNGKVSPRAWNIARNAASTRRLDWTHETSQSRILRRAAVDDMQDTPPVLAPLRSVLLSVQAHHQRRRNDRFCRCQRVEVDACSEGSEPHLADPRPMELARAGRPADRQWKRQNGFVVKFCFVELACESGMSRVLMPAVPVVMSMSSHLLL